MRSPQSTLRLVRSWLALIAIVYLAFELIAFTGLVILEKRSGIAYEPALFELTKTHRWHIRQLINGGTADRILCPTLGWTNKPDSSLTPAGRTVTEGITIRINGQGLRGSREYALTSAPRTTRILAFGDSFTFGVGVDNRDCWTEKLSAADPDLDVLNFGVAGFALDQALLRYEAEGRRFHPDIVLMGFMTENIMRHVNVFRPFLYRVGFPVAKPRFLRERGSLKLCPNPLPTPAHYRRLLADEREVIPRLGAQDFFYRRKYHAGRFDRLPSVRLCKVLTHNLLETRGAQAIICDDQYNTGSEAFQVTVEIFNTFAATVTRDGAQPVAVIFPHLDDLKRFRGERTKAYAPLLDALQLQGIEHVDLMDAFDSPEGQAAAEHYFSKDSHYSPLGNEVVARHLREWLENRGLI